jgi:hypothetical protein
MTRTTTYAFEPIGDMSEAERKHIIKTQPHAWQVAGGLTRDELQQHAYNRMAKRVDVEHADDARVTGIGSLVSDSEPGTMRLVTITSKGFMIVFPPQPIPPAPSKDTETS